MLTTDGRRRLILRALQAWDLCMFGVALGVAWCVEKPEITDSLSPQAWTPLVWVLAVLPLWHLSLARAGLYKSRRLSGGTGELWDVVKGVALASVLMATGGLLLRVGFVTPRFVEAVWLSATTLTVGSRLCLRVFLKLVRRAGRNLRFILVIGSGPRTRRLMEILERRPELGYRIHGYLDERDGNNGHPDPSISRLPFLGTLKDLPAVLAQHVVDEVFVTLPMKSFYDRTAMVIRMCEEQGIQVRLPVDLFDLGSASPQIDVFEGIPILALAPNGACGRYAFIKRTLDIVMSLSLLLVLSPLFLVVAWLIKRSSPGAVFFVQERVGLNKRRFGLIKFRTMVQNGEALLSDLLHLNEATGPVFKIRNDPRVTRVGRFLRRSSIDELPQLINVLKGEMSLVGPRPLPLRDVEAFTEDWQRRRFSVKPGITGLWQVSGRSSIPFDRWMELDMAYINASSLKLD
ncbi:MAG TPA: sugar transferase, partial [Candidatus Acidoferrum sp.]|nr:sugar transferase [Candidatus Acidoferrum sp.]